MKKTLFILLLTPFMSFTQSFTPTSCECAKYVVASMQLEFSDDKSELKTLKELEKKYDKKCEKFADQFLDMSLDGDRPFFKQEFVDCILEDRASSFCKCTFLLVPALMEALMIGFSDDIPKSIADKREKFWDRNGKSCDVYGNPDQWDEAKAEKCFRILLSDLRKN